MIPIYDRIVTKGMNIIIIEFERQTLSLTSTWILGVLDQDLSLTSGSMGRDGISLWEREELSHQDVLHRFLDS